MNQRKASSWALAVKREKKSSSEDVETTEGETSQSVSSHEPSNAPSLTPTPKNTCRCRHLEECMFPRYLTLDAKTLDDFCMGKVDEHHGKNASRLYIESLHLKPFLKDKETLIKEHTAKRKEAQNQPGKDKKPDEGTAKRPRLPLRRNSSPDSKAKTEPPPRQVKSEGIVDQNLLSQTYFGGINGKRTWFLSNNNKIDAGGGIAGTYCPVLPTSTVLALNQWNKKTHAGILRVGKKKSTKDGAVLSPGEKFNNTLSSEKKLTTLRGQLKLHDRLGLLDCYVTGESAEAPPDDDKEVNWLEGLIRPIVGYSPPKIVASVCDAISDTNRSSPGGQVLETASSISKTKKFNAEHKAKEITSLEKKSQLSVNVTARSSNNNSQSTVPQEIVTTIVSTGGDAKKVSNASESKENNSSTPPTQDAAYKLVIDEGKEQSMAANLLLEAFRRSRKRFWSNLCNDHDIKCAWCSSSKTNGDNGKAQAGDALIQCLECDLVGCSSNCEQHILLHFFISGHRYGVSCGPAGELFCMGCGDFVHHECFDQERERLFIENNFPTLSWKDTPILRGVDASSLAMIPEHGYVWRGMLATYPIPVSSNLVLAARSAAKRLCIFRGHAGERSVEWGEKSLQLSLYLREHGRHPLIPTPVGSFNMGNTCFMSSILQCLLNCLPLEKLFLRDLVHPYLSCQALRHGHKEGCLACGLDEIFLEYFGSSNGIDAVAAVEENNLASSLLSSSRFSYDENAIYTKKNERVLRGHPLIMASLLAETWKHVEMKALAGQNQNDAQEFFSAFVNSLADGDISYQKLCSSLTQLSRPTQIMQTTLDEMNKLPNQGPVSKIKNIFTGSLRSILVCQHCGRKRTQVESFLNVSLSLLKGLHTQSVEKCLDHMTKEETLTDLVHCPKCKTKTKSSQQHAFATLPEVLCLHLKRFDSAANKKITDAVSFPAHGLDMGKYLAHWCENRKPMRPQDEDDGPKVLYDLYATVNHKGSLHQGHYTTNVLKEGCWYTINDECVSQAGEGNGEKEVLLNMTTSYMLFYSRRN